MELGDGALVADSSSSSSSAGVTNDGGFSFNPLDAFDDIMNTDNVESFEDNLDLSFDTVAAFAFSGDHADYDGDDGEDADDGDDGDDADDNDFGVDDSDDEDYSPNSRATRKANKGSGGSSAAADKLKLTLKRKAPAAKNSGGSRKRKTAKAAAVDRVDSGASDSSAAVDGTKKPTRSEMARSSRQRKKEQVATLEKQLQMLQEVAKQRMAALGELFFFHQSVIKIQQRRLPFLRNLTTFVANLVLNLFFRRSRCFFEVREPSVRARPAPPGDDIELLSPAFTGGDETGGLARYRRGGLRLLAACPPRRTQHRHRAGQQVDSVHQGRGRDRQGRRLDPPAAGTSARLHPRPQEERGKGGHDAVDGSNVASYGSEPREAGGEKCCSEHWRGSGGEASYSYGCCCCHRHCCLCYCCLRRWRRCWCRYHGWNRNGFADHLRR
jgi:cell division protein FtsB